MVNPLDIIVHKWLRVPYRLNYAIMQSPKKPRTTIFLLHGIGSSSKMWQVIQKGLPSDARVIAIDLLGFGQSPKPDWSIYDAKVQADCIVTTLLSLKIFGPVVVVGHSLGALVAIEFAKRYSFATKSLVLVSPPLYNPDKNPKKFDFGPDEILQRLYRLMHERPNDTERILRFATKYNVINKGYDAETLNIAAYLATLEAAIINNKSALQYLTTIAKPVHIISGRLDALVIDKNIKALTKQNLNITHQSVVAAHEIIGLMIPAVTKAINQAAEEAVSVV